MKTKLEAYRHADTMGKSPVELVIMVYDGAIKALRTAADKYRRNDTQAGYDELQQAKRMVTHLYTTLDREQGGQVAASLGRMYTWVISQLLIIEATKNVDQLAAVIEVMNNLRSGWDTLRAQTNDNTGKSTADSEAVPEHVVVTA